MVDAIANLSLEILRDLLVEETKFLLNVSGEVEKVKRDLQRIHAMLMKADRKRSDSPTLKLYVAQLKDLAFEAEIVLETYAVGVESKRGGRRRSLKEKLQRYICIMCECSTVHEVGKQTSDILSRLSGLTGRLESEFGQQSMSLPSDREYLLRQTYAHEVEPHFVGMEKEIEEIVSMAKDETAGRRRVVKIYGMGGLGKTTLARKIYNHGEVAPYARAWACATRQFNAKAVLSRVLKQLDDKADIDGMGVPELVGGIYGFLVQRKKSLVVIDDIWDNDDWEIIKKAFPMGCNVLLTTRNENIANQESHRYKLEFLTEDQGWDLLKKIALPQDSASVEMSLKSLEDIGRQVIVKCGRLPLSISVIGGILRQKDDDDIVTEWEKVSSNIDLYLRHGEGVTEYTRVKQVLDLSYDALPYYLKPCFLYLACFVEDEEIETERLYLLWMAEGFVSYQDKGREETLRDVAQRYLSELGMRCMVQVHKAEIYSPHKKFDSCRLHDLMHDLCSSKAEEENLLKRVEISKHRHRIALKSTSTSTNTLVMPQSIENTVSRLAIILDDGSDVVGRLGIEGLEELKDLRSIVLIRDKEYCFQRIRFHDSTINFERSRCLRILVLENCEFEGDMLPKKVGKLIHLRYLSLWDSDVRDLPEFVCRMPYLQTLDLRVSDVKAILRLPNLFWKMKKLKHLFLPFKIEVIGGDKLKLDGLDELETLQKITSATSCISDIPKLVSAQTLEVTVADMDSMSTLVHHMIGDITSRCRRSCETHLTIDTCDLSLEAGKSAFENVLISRSLVSLRVLRCDVSGGFPRYERGACTNLVRLFVVNCKVGGAVNVMEELGKYPKLQVLYLGGKEVGLTEATCRRNSFPQLKSLTLKEVHSLERWEVEERAMRKLTRCTICDCPILEKVPEGLRFVSTLGQLSISKMPKEFIERVRGQDYGSVSHIPSLDIRDD